MLFVITGPESTGKTTLAHALTKKLNAPMVDEFARAFLVDRTDYRPSDLLTIATHQSATENDALSTLPISPNSTDPILFADTDLQVVYLWWQEKFGPAPLGLSRAYAQQSKRHYLLCEPDIEWEADPLRENPYDRDRLYKIYEEDLLRRKLAFTPITGSGEQRNQCAFDAVAKLLSV